MDMTKLGADLQAAVNDVVKLTNELTAAQAHLQGVADAQNKAVQKAQALRDQFTTALSAVVPASPTPRNL